ncbi:unnamed protein product [Caretta caretta]
MPSNKSPGMDGLTVEFYRTFWDILGPDLVTVWAESLQSGVLPLSCRRAVLTLLPKKGDRRDLRNWRPVSLLSTDYKIVAKAISLRLGSVMVDVIHPDQTYTVPGRSIFDNLFLVRDLLELGRRDGLSFALLSLDQEKAFDRVDHGYLLSTLRAFGFGPQFVSFLRVLCASAECLVRLNWTLTEPVSFGQEVRQGCPLSGQLYALAIEPFLCLLRRRMTGLVLREPELRLVLSAYADDVLLVVQDPGDLARGYLFGSLLRPSQLGQELWLGGGGLAADAAPYDDDLQALDDDFNPLLDIVAECFYSYVQMAHKPINHYISALYVLSLTCEFASFTDEMIRDQIVMKTNCSKEMTTAHCQVQVNSHDMRILVDSGSPYMIIPNQLYTVLFASSHPALHPQEIHPGSYGGLPIPINAYFTGNY